MKLQLIMTEPPIAVSDLQPVKGDKVLDTYANLILDCTESNLGTNAYDYFKKIIAGLPELPTIDFSSLSEKDCKKIGYVRLENFIKDNYKKHSVKDDALSLNEQIQRSGGFSVGFSEGFKLAQQMNDKKYSEEDILVDFCIKTFYPNSDPEGTDYDKCLIYARNYINSLKQPRVYDIEVEMEEVCRLEYSNERCIHCINGCDKDFEIPKITNNSIKITDIL